jgi:hypothetical protein
MSEQHPWQSPRERAARQQDVGNSEPGNRDDEASLGMPTGGDGHTREPVAAGKRPLWKIVAGTIVVLVVVTGGWAMSQNSPGPIPQTAVTFPSSPAPSTPAETEAPSGTPTATTPAKTGGGTLTSEELNQFNAEGAAVALAEASVARDGKDGLAGLLDAVRPLMTDAAYTGFAAAAAQWDWAGCRAANCRLRGVLTKVAPTVGAPDDGLATTVIMQVTNGSGENPPVIGETELNITVDPATLLVSSVTVVEHNGD